MRFISFLIPLLMSLAAIAGESKSVTLAVEHMTCAACPITVKKALSSVAGVQQVAVDLESHSATVTFDPAVVEIAALEAAVTNAGYPAHANRAPND